MATLEKFCVFDLYYDANLISDEDFLLLYEMLRRKTPIFHMTSINAVTRILNMSEAECKAKFRFDKKDLPVLPEALQIPP